MGGRDASSPASPSAACCSCAAAARLLPSRPGEEEREEDDDATSCCCCSCCCRPSSSSGTWPATGKAREGGKRGRCQKLADTCHKCEQKRERAAVSGGGRHSLSVRRSADIWASVGRPGWENVANAMSNRNWSLLPFPRCILAGRGFSGCCCCRAVGPRCEAAGPCLEGMRAAAAGAAAGLRRLPPAASLPAARLAAAAPGDVSWQLPAVLPEAGQRRRRGEGSLV